MADQPTEKTSRSVLRRFEAEFLRPYRGPILLGLLGLLFQSVLLLPIPLLQGWVVDQLVEYYRAGGQDTEARASRIARSIGLAGRHESAVRGAVAVGLRDRQDDGSDQPGGRGRAPRRFASQADATADGLFRCPADGPADGAGSPATSAAS